MLEIETVTEITIISKRTWTGLGTWLCFTGLNEQLMNSFYIYKLLYYGSYCGVLLPAKDTNM